MKLEKRKFLIVFTVLTLILAGVIPLLPLSGEERVYDDTLRLHIIANSDSDVDRKLKLSVRDAVLETVSEYIDGIDNIEDAKTAVVEHKAEITAKAVQTLRENGFSYDVEFLLGKEYYPEREYDGVTLPSGTYTSLRLVIGEGKGHNWWCILYPTLCTGASKPEKELKEAGFTPEQIRILTQNESPKYKIKFKIVEFFENLFS